jgi:hypothetical protein
MFRLLYQELILAFTSKSKLWRELDTLDNRISNIDTNELEGVKQRSILRERRNDIANKLWLKMF